MVIETIFFASIEDIKIVDLHVHGSIQFSDADISFIKNKLYLWKYSHYISHLHLPGRRQACDGIIQKSRNSGINDESNYFSSGWLYFLSFIKKSVVTVCGCESDHFERCNLDLSNIHNSKLARFKNE